MGKKILIVRNQIPLIGKSLHNRGNAYQGLERLFSNAGRGGHSLFALAPARDGPGVAVVVRSTRQKKNSLAGATLPSLLMKLVGTTGFEPATP